jgi:hypothetical protein
MKTKILPIRGSVFLAVPLIAVTGIHATYSTSGMVSIPTDEYLQHLQFEVDFITSFSGSEEVAHYGCAKGNLGLYGLIELGLSVYSMWDSPAFVGNMKFEIIDEEHYWRYQPAVSVGLDNIAYRPNVSSAGNRYTGDTDAYREGLDDRYSFYLVSTKNLYPIGVFHLGWGSGRFIGYGPYSKYFHGVFLGYQREIYGPVEFMAEADGRDINIGGRVNIGWLSFTVALEKFEQIGRHYDPYFTLGLEVSNETLHVGNSERLKLRRSIRGLNNKIVDVQSKVRIETSEVNRLREELEQLEAEAEKVDVETGEINEMRLELENLRRQVEEKERTGTI